MWVCVCVVDVIVLIVIYIFLIESYCEYFCIAQVIFGHFKDYRVMLARVEMSYSDIVGQICGGIYNFFFVVHLFGQKQSAYLL